MSKANFAGLLTQEFYVVSSLVDKIGTVQGVGEGQKCEFNPYYYYLFIFALEAFPQPFKMSILLHRVLLSVPPQF